MAKENNGAPGIDGITFEAIEGSGLEEFLLSIQGELLSGMYLPMQNRRKEKPKETGKYVFLGYQLSGIE
jgi:RNA-directed DNA polymerase